MCSEYFGLRGEAFSATPDPEAFYENACYREAYATLLYGVMDRKGFIVLTGEVGTGKTTLLRRLMDHLGTAVRFVFFYNTTLTFDEMVDFMCAELELPVEGVSRVAKLTCLNKVLIDEAVNGRTVVLLLDEAQNLSPEVLESLRLISNLETATEKLLQIVLVGQPELAITLADPGLRQFTQRVALRHRLLPLASDEVDAFIAYRLQRVGRPRQDLFAPDAVRRIAVYSKGVPRLINILCAGALLLAYGAEATRVNRAMIDEVAADLGLGAAPQIARREATRHPARRREVTGHRATGHDMTRYAASTREVTTRDVPATQGRHLESLRRVRRSSWSILGLRRHPRARVPERRFRWLTVSLLAAGVLLGSVSVLAPPDSSVAARLADVGRSLATIPSSIGELVHSIARQWRPPSTGEPGLATQSQ
jgi:general secretion pathway protein A